tara:strand:- start:16069 stop:16485 length:417 start_codon:yes stop_codon:yes gene_type:complete
MTTIPETLKMQKDYLNKIEDIKKENEELKKTLKELNLNEFIDPFSYIQNTNSKSVTEKKIKQNDFEILNFDKQLDIIPRQITRLLGNEIIEYHEDKSNKAKQEKLLKKIKSIKRIVLAITAGASIFAFTTIISRIRRR